MTTVTLELAKQLKDAGYPQESHFYWVWDAFQNNHILKTYSPAYITGKNTQKYPNGPNWITAPTADEILDLLPAYITLSTFLYIWKDDKGLYRIVYCSSADLVAGGEKPNYPVEKQKTLAEAAGLMWLHLKKEKLL